MNPYRKKAIKPQAAQWLPFGAVKPAGWMRAQMQRDLQDGFVGHLDELAPDLIQKDDIYGADRLTRAVRAKNLGVVAVETDWQVQFLWWNSETQSNWRDGWLRTALLLDEPACLARVRAYVNHILATQDADGYLGIYAPDLRFNFNSENGELWAQASLFRALLGFYEATAEPRVLEAVRRAVALTMWAYPLGQSQPFTVQDDYAGVCHGLMFTDVLDRLYQLTGQETYLDYALWLYAEYSQNKLSADDIRYTHLADDAYRFQAHGVHTYEHLRSLLTAVYASGNPRLEQALQAYLEKLETCLTPSVAPIGDENIGGRMAEASETGYEYCSIHELLDSYTHLLQKTGQARWGDRIEWLLFNAGQGARHPQESAIAYLKTDNSFSMSGPLHPADPVDPKFPQTRYKYSPVHQDVAVCCVPNAGRIYPYYVKSMWLRTPQGLLAALYGACQLVTEIDGAAVSISEQTDYPFEHEITFSIDVSKPVTFEIALRVPAWATGFEIRVDGEWHADNEWVKIRKTWHAGEKIVLRFEAQVKTHQFRNDEFFLSYGALVYALPLDGQVSAGKQYPLAGFRDLYYAPATAPAPELRLAPSSDFSLERQPFDPAHPWDATLHLSGRMLNPATGELIPVRLVPLGGTILRKLSHKKQNSSTS